MAYRRRYLSGQAATTVVIAEGAITSDKIVDGAVTHPKIAPGAVDSERVVDSSLKSEDIKDGEIKSADIASGAVTTDKIASQAVTVDKLEASIQGIARPLTPGVDTAEIQDGKVTLAKLAPDSVDASKIKSGAVGPTELAANAVETDRVKDGAISTAKIAGSAVDSTKIAANAVTGSEILNRAVGNLEIAIEGVQSENIKDLNVGASKLALNSVETDKIKDYNVAEWKIATAALARRHVESKETRIIHHLEEFGGLDISNRWRKFGDPGCSVLPDGKNGIKIETSAISSDAQQIDWGGQGIEPALDAKPIMNIWVPTRHATLNYLKNYLGLWFDDDNEIMFYVSDIVGATPNWQARCRKAVAETTVDTGIALSAAPQAFKIEVVDFAKVLFYINGAEVAEINTNIPTGVELEPRLKIQTLSANARHFSVKYVSILANRPGYA